ncbi:MAG: ARMT1-like domain-containing protein [Candidatus Zixiibacteriota bacterium]
MKTYLECIPCIIDQTINIARQVTEDDEKQRVLVQRVMETLSSLSYRQSPPYLGREAHRTIRKMLNNHDPFLKLKKEFNEVAKELYPSLKEKVNSCPDKFACAIRLAIAGNVIDFGPSHHFELIKTIKEVSDKKPAVDDTKSLKTDLERASLVLYLGDNAGETFFDRILIEQMPRLDVYYAVRGSPVINDATSEDAYYAGLDRVAKVVSNGSDAPGTILEDCSQRFRRLFDRADLVIAKGHGNYETLSEVRGKKLYFLLMVKCKIIARDLGCSVGDFVVKKVENKASDPNQKDRVPESDGIKKAGLS